MLCAVTSSSEAIASEDRSGRAPFLVFGNVSERRSGLVTMIRRSGGVSLGEVGEESDECRPVRRANLAANTCDTRPQLPESFPRNSTRVGTMLGAGRLHSNRSAQSLFFTWHRRPGVEPGNPAVAFECISASLSLQAPDPRRHSPSTGYSCSRAPTFQRRGCRKLPNLCTANVQVLPSRSRAL
jgi:hypothetical protein